VEYIKSLGVTSVELLPNLVRPPAKLRTFGTMFRRKSSRERSDRAAFEVKPEHGADRLGLLGHDDQLLVHGGAAERDRAPTHSPLRLANDCGSDSHGDKNGKKLPHGLVGAVTDCFALASASAHKAAIHNLKPSRGRPRPQ
jgi:hypothetical protein